MRRCALVIAAFACLLAPGSPVAAQVLPPNFQQEVVFGGLEDPVVTRFAADGRVFVAEKSGLIKVFDGLTDSTPTTYADLRTEVHNFWDRGLLGMALDPQFPADPYVYVLYTHDAAIGQAAPRWGVANATTDPCPNPPGATQDGCVVSGRLSRLDGAGRETVLVEDWCQQYPSHSQGQLQFGPDGALYASSGDGASFTFADYGQDGSPRNPCGDPPGGVGSALEPPTAEGGALRAQDLRTSGDPVTLDGTIIRVSPDTGAGLPGNPLFGSADPNAKRIVAYGLRNPYRTTFRPGTSELWIGDVGYGKYDEIDRVTDLLGTAENGGWPCIEGPSPPPAYESLDLNICEGLYAAPASAKHAPYFSYAHTDKVVAGETCPSGSTSTSGLAFYQGGPYPAAYDGALFFADYSRDCIWAMQAGPNGLPDTSDIVTFVASAASPVELEIGPGGDLFYTDFDGGKVWRIRYFAGNQPPVAVAEATPTSGAAPLQVDFDATGSSDPNGDALTYSWDLDGNGSFGDSTSATPSRTYTTAGNVIVRLRVSDGGLAATDSVLISVGNTAPVATIVTPTAATTWEVGQSIPFAGKAVDAQEGTLPASAYSWELVMHHCPSNCHDHHLEAFPDVTGGTFDAPDHEYPSHLELRLTVTDSGGLEDTVSVLLYPRTVDLALAANVPGLKLTLDDEGGAAPFDRTVIEGSAHVLSAPATEDLRGVRYAFRSWSDGGPRVHSIAAAGPATYTARYAAVSADLDLTSRAYLKGTLLTFVLRLRNDGPRRARKVVLTDTLPKRVWWGWADVGGGHCARAAGSRNVTCSLGSMAAGQLAVVRLRTWLFPSTDTVVNAAGATSSTPDARRGNNRSRRVFEVG